MNCSACGALLEDELDACTMCGTVAVASRSTGSGGPSHGSTNSDDEELDGSTIVDVHDDEDEDGEDEDKGGSADSSSESSGPRLKGMIGGGRVHPRDDSGGTVTAKRDTATGPASRSTPDATRHDRRLLRALDGEDVELDGSDDPTSDDTDEGASGGVRSESSVDATARRVPMVRRGAESDDSEAAKTDGAGTGAADAPGSPAAATSRRARAPKTPRSSAGRASEEPAVSPRPARAATQMLRLARRIGSVLVAVWLLVGAILSTSWAWRQDWLDPVGKFWFIDMTGPWWWRSVAAVATGVVVADFLSTRRGNAREEDPGGMATGDDGAK